MAILSPAATATLVVVSVNTPVDVNETDRLVSAPLSRRVAVAPVSDVITFA